MTRLKVLTILVSAFLLAGNGNFLMAQESHSLIDEDSTGKFKRQEKIRVTTYVRVVSDNKGSLRMDENIVPNVKLTKFLRLEAGLRYGEKPALFNAYFHYKLELQSKFFWKKVRVFGRISDNAVNYTSPTYRRTNELLIIEGRQLLTRYLQASLGVGYLFSTQQNYQQKGGESKVINESPMPTTKGSHLNSPMLKMALKYDFRGSAAVEAAWGTYDVFNPYSLNTPFTQISGEYELAEALSITSYLRYQYQYNFFRPYNYFLSLGLVYHGM